MRHRAILIVLVISDSIGANERVIQEMERRTRLPVAEIREIAKSGCESGNQSQMNMCMEYHFVGSDLELNDTYQTLLHRLQEPSARKALVAAHRSWIAYRDTHCRFDSIAWEGGSIRQMATAACLKGITEERTKQFRGYLECESPDCPALLPSAQSTTPPRQ